MNDFFIFFILLVLLYVQYWLEQIDERAEWQRDKLFELKKKNQEFEELLKILLFQIVELKNKEMFDDLKKKKKKERKNE